ncbi:MAG TPA: hypothetical protein VNA69_20795 [Thermoanaerobaculia bacterium]|nr:hypothetical protein [Thermoanaerobaculia bacterium]
MQVVSIAGALMVLSAFAAHQLKRLGHETYAYQSLNLAGGFLLLLAALSVRQTGLIIMEGAWTVISAWGLWRVGRSVRSTR